MATARKLQPSPRDRSSDIPASQDWSSETLASDWLEQLAAANKLSTERLHRASAYSDPTGEQAVARAMRAKTGGKHCTARRKGGRR